MSGSLTTTAYCWTIERRDGAGLALTSHDRDLTVGGTVYAARPGMAPAAIERRLGLSESDSEVAGALADAALSEDDLGCGRWDGARVRLSAADWDEPEAGMTPLVTGEIGEVERAGQGFRAALRGAAAQLSRPVAPATSSECRAELGDARCRVDMGPRRRTVAVTVASGRSVTLSAPAGADYRWGRLRFLSGRNAGLRGVVVSSAGTQITLRDLPAFAIEPGALLRIEHGCDKLFATCRTRFANAENFRGEPHLPGNDLLTRYPGE